MYLLYHAYMYLEFLILACTIYILAPLLKLKIENAFLKELRRLRLEDEAKMRERRKSSTVSEDSSN